MKNSKKAEPESEQQIQINVFAQSIKERSDRLMNYFLAGYFLLGIFLSTFYDTWNIGIGVGGMCLISYYSAKYLLPETKLYQYVVSAVFGVFMAQFIYQMHGLFEMHFLAFIGSAILITYQNWKLQLPIASVVVIHHGIFGYLQFIGFDQIFFTQLNYMDLQTFIIHALLATTIFFICGLWAYHFKKYSEKQIEQSFEIGRLEVAEKQREELKKANFELDKFVYSVSHDLRAPLKSMAGVIQITEEESTDVFVRAHMGLLQESIEKLDKFILDVLDYSRNARSEVRKEEINFKEILDDITRNLKYMGDKNRQVAISVEILGDKPFCSDRSRINVVLNNLISNAIRYQNNAVEDPFVNVKVDMSDTEANIIIKDNGIGISKELHSKIFEMFYRVTENSVGSGLGLYLVKETVDKLNGEILVDSQIGVGTEFSLSIPNLYS